MLADILGQIERLNLRSVALAQEARYEEAMSVATQAHDLARQHFQQHPVYADALNNLAALHGQLGNYAEAERLLQQALESNRQTVGTRHPDYARNLSNLAVVHHKTGRYAEAEALYQEALEIQRITIREKSPVYAATLSDLAKLYQALGKYAMAEPMLQQAVEIVRASVGEESSRFAVALTNLGELHHERAKYAQAEPLLRQAMEIMGAALGKQHPNFAACLKTLGSCYKDMGRYQAAQSLYRQASEIELAAFGKEHPAYAMSLSGLAAVCEEQGNLSEAEQLHRAACEIVRNNLGEQHPSYAASRGNIAKLYYRLGDYQAAEEHLLQAVEINLAVFGEQSLDFAHSLNDLARLYDVSGKLHDTEPLYWRALNIWRKSGGAYHPGYANCLNDVGAMYSRRGDYESYRKAEFYYQLASDIRQIVYGKEHSMSAMSLNNLASVYDALGDYVAAEPVYREACDIARRVWGEDHSLYARCLENLAGLCVARDRVAEAIPMLQQAMAIHDRTIGHVFAFTSESQRLIYLKTVQDSFYSFLSLALDHASDSPAIRGSAFDLVLRRKAVVAESLALQREAVLAGEYGDLKSKLEELSSVRMQIAQKTLAGSGEEEPSAYEQWLKQQNALKESLETELARHIPEMNLTRKLRLADRWAVSLGLPDGAALVEFVRFDVFDFKAVPARGELRWGPAHYLAFVLPAGEPDNLQMIDLGEAKPIDQIIGTFRSAITEEEEGRGKRDLGALPSEPVGEPNTSDGTALRAALFDPLLPAICNRNRLLLAPDGDLTRLPFEALPIDDGRRLIDDYQISYLGVGRDVLRFGAASSGQPAAALVAADPDFDLGGGQAQAEATSETAGEAHNAHRVSREIQTGDLERLGRLPGTRVEGERIARMLGVKPLLGEKALEASIKACRSPRILHLATHGFFLADRRRDPNRELRGPGLLGGQAGDGFGQMPKSMLDRMSGPGMENPLLRSGVLLAGFKTWLKGGSLPAEAEDGLLTAEDVSGLDLLATELVVLSACETGLGEVRTGEGVFGLRRAFVLAGAKTLVMSLWKVPDLATAILMERFYDYLLNRRDSLDRPFSRSESLREAQFHTRDVTIGQIRDRWLNAEMIERLSAGDEETREYLERLARRPDNHCPFTHPKFWGAFICQGDPGPLPMRD